MDRAQQKETIRARHQRANAILFRLNTVKAPVMAEVGVLVGALSEVLLTSRQTMHLTMIDSWAPADQLPDAYRATGDVHGNQTAAQAEAHYQAALEVAGRFGKRAQVVRKPSLEAASLFSGRSVFDLVFLDADHSRAAVLADLDAWAPLISRGGYICGHDYGHTDPQFSFGVKEAVDEWAAQRGLRVELDADFTWFCRLP